MNMKQVGLIMLPLLLSGCMSTNNKVTISDSNHEAALCCTELEDLAYVPISHPGEVEVVITDSSPIVRLQDGQSHVQAIELPRSKSEVTIEVSSLLTEQAIKPNILILDNKYKVIDVINEEITRFQRSGLINQNQLGGSFTLPETASMLSASYLVFFTPTETGQAYTVREKPSDLALRSGNVKANQLNNSDLKSVHTSTGSFLVDFSYVPSPSISESNHEIESVVLAGDISKAENKNTKQMYHDLISYAIENDDIPKAIQYVEQARKEGHHDIDEVFINEIKKQN